MTRQLDRIGCAIAAEYAIYVVFCLSRLCIVSVLGPGRLRAAGRSGTATCTERWTRVVFLLAVVGTLLGTAGLSGRR